MKVNQMWVMGESLEYNITYFVFSEEIQRNYFIFIFFCQKINFMSQVKMS